MVCHQEEHHDYTRFSTYQGLAYSGLKETMSHDYLAVSAFVTLRDNHLPRIYPFCVINIMLLSLLLLYYLVSKCLCCCCFWIN